MIYAMNKESIHGLEGTPLGEHAKKREKEVLSAAPLRTRLTPEELQEKRLEEISENDPFTDIGYEKRT
jgi:hypothetical protein